MVEGGDHEATGGLVEGDDGLAVGVVEDLHAGADVAAVLGKDKGLGVGTQEAALDHVAVEEAPAAVALAVEAAVDGLPVAPGEGAEPGHVAVEVARHVEAGGVAVAVFGVPQWFAGLDADGAIEADAVAAAALVAVDVDLGDEGLDLGRVGAPSGEGVVVGGFVRGGKGHVGEALAVEGGANEGQDLDLGGGGEVGALLFAVGVPVVAGGLVKSGDGGEGDAPVVFGAAGDGGEVVGEVFALFGAQIFVFAAGGAGGVVVFAHPPGSGVGKELEVVRAAVTGFEQHFALVGVGGPVPAVGSGVRFFRVEPEGVDLTERQDGFGADHATAVDLVEGGGTGIIAGDVHAEGGQAEAVDQDLVARGVEPVGEVGAVAEDLGPPAQGDAPALPDAAVAGGRIDAQGAGSRVFGVRFLAGQVSGKGDREGAGND